MIYMITYTANIRFQIPAEVLNLMPKNQLIEKKTTKHFANAFSIYNSGNSLIKLSYLAPEGSNAIISSATKYRSLMKV
jgi:predicted transcriptional regulator